MDVELNEPAAGDIGWLISSHGEQYTSQFSFDADFELDIARKALSFLDNKHPFDRMLIGHNDNERVASIAISRKTAQTAFINFVLVASQYRSRGIAHQLLDTVIAHAVAHDYTLIHLETYSCLKAARKLYKKYGFEMYEKNCDVKKYGHTFDQEFWKKKL